MKTVSFFAFALSLVVTSVSAQAETLLVHRMTDGQFVIGGAQYQVSAELGRAWMELTFLVSNRNNESSKSPFSPFYMRAKVPGLSYDVANSQIVFAGAKGTVVCATTSVKHSFWGTKLLINPTGKCATRTEYAAHQEDDGFEMRTVHTYDTYFSTQE
jgi:hypothetical protein